jgi:hypothetical protein
MSYHNLPARYPGMYQLDEASGLWVPRRKERPPKKGSRICHVRFCTRQRDRVGGNLVCITCRSRIWKANNPVRAIFNAIRNKASRRGIPFEISYEYFEALCRETDFHPQTLLPARPDAACPLESAR